MNHTHNLLTLIDILGVVGVSAAACRVVHWLGVRR